MIDAVLDLTELLQRTLILARVAHRQAVSIYGENSETAIVLSEEVMPVLRLVAGRRLIEKAHEDEESSNHE